MVEVDVVVEVGVVVEVDVVVEVGVVVEVEVGVEVEVEVEVGVDVVMSKYTPPKLFIHGDINTDSFSDFSIALLAVELEAPRNFNGYDDYVDVELVSDGGSAYDALAFYDRIRGSRLNIRITGLGLVASAAVLILASGDYRILTPNSWVMVHEDASPYVKHDLVHQAEKRLRHARLLESQWCTIMMDSTRTDFNTWTKLHKEETYLWPKECLALGLIEEIV